MPSTGRTVATQTAVQVLGKIASIALGVAAIAIITRSLGREGYGWYATVMAYLQLFGIAVDLGLNGFGTDDARRTPGIVISSGARDLTHWYGCTLMRDCHVAFGSSQ
jgi:hypothetical protein